MSVNDERALTPTASISGAATSARTHVGTLAAACIAVFIAQVANAMPIAPGFRRYCKCPPSDRKIGGELWERQKAR